MSDAIFGRPSKIHTPTTGYLRKPLGCSENGIEDIMGQLVVAKLITSWDYDREREAYVLRKEV